MSWNTSRSRAIFSTTRNSFCGGFERIEEPPRGKTHMEILVINGKQVRDLLPMHECMDAMEAALVALRKGEALNPLRTVIGLPDQSGYLITMPSYVDKAMGVKVISVM